jgi:hypothetical protein
MSRGPGQIEQRIGELFAATKDGAFSVAELCEVAFRLNGATPSRAQRLSATRAGHRIVSRGSRVGDRCAALLKQVLAETREILGLKSGDSSLDGALFARGMLDKAFVEAVKRAPSEVARRKAWLAVERERTRFGGASFKWRTTETVDRRLWFHPADYPVRVWAVAIQPDGVVWADTEIVRITGEWVSVRYQGEPARLSRRKLARHWTLHRNV